MENQNQVPSQTQPLASQVPTSSTPPLSPEPKHKGKIWKIVGIIVASVIVIFLLLVWYGSKIDDQSTETSQPLINNQQNTTMDNQKDNTSAEDYLAMQSESSDYRKFADKVVVELAKGNTKYLNDNLSPNLIAANSQDAVNSTFLPAAKKLFTNFDHIGNSVTIQPSTDSYGNSGYSFAMTAVYKDNTEKDFKIYIIKEGGKLVVGNIVD